MDYAEYQADPDYAAKQAGAAVAIVLYDQDNPDAAIIGNLTGLSWSDDFEQNPVEEAGNDGVDEHATGRHTVTGNFNGFFSAERNDALPTRQSFLNGGKGKKYTIMQVIGGDRLGEGLPLNVWLNAKITRVAGQHGARGIITFDGAFVATTRMSGEEWFAEMGS